MISYKQNGFDATLRDNFLRGKPLINSPLPLLLSVVYLVFIKKIGPHWMRNKPAYDLSKVLIVYNVVQVLFSMYLVYLGTSLILTHGLFDSSCRALSETFVNNTLFAGYCYVLAKITELLDTVFFVLRKKQNQVTFLHVYHHCLMVIVSWLALLYEKSFTVAFAATLNSFVHVIMYGYYCLSTIPALRKYLWWKKYLTTMQLIQFCVVMIHVTIYIATTKCPQSYVLAAVVLVNAIIFLYLFSQFYVKTYIKQKPNDINTKIINEINNNSSDTNSVESDKKEH